MSNIDTFITRWQAAEAAELANFPLFASELCDLIGVPPPEPTRADDNVNAHVFERNVTFHHADSHTSTGRIGLYKRGCFVLEAKQVGSAPTETRLFNNTPAAGRRGTARCGNRSWDAATNKG